MTTSMIIGIVLLYLGILVGVWRYSYELLQYKQDDAKAFIVSFFIGLFWPASGIARVIRWILNCLIKRYSTKL